MPPAKRCGDLGEGRGGAEEGGAEVTLGRGTLGRGLAEGHWAEVTLYRTHGYGVSYEIGRCAPLIGLHMIRQSNVTKGFRRLSPAASPGDWRATLSSSLSPADSSSRQ
jgi:hypothetical protein